MGSRQHGFVCPHCDGFLGLERQLTATEGETFCPWCEANVVAVRWARYTDARTGRVYPDQLRHPASRKAAANATVPVRTADETVDAISV